MFLFKRLLQSFKQLLERLTELPQQLLRLLRRLSRRPGQPQVGQAGFVLPTVTMVILVVVLTSTTLVFRSIDRARNASNFRVNQVVMNAAAPAIERAKAKVNAVFADPLLPRGTPADIDMTRVFEKSKYTLDDEVRLVLASDFGNGTGDFNEDGTVQVNTADSKHSEVITTAWRFPVDTDGNGLYDSFTLYGIYYRKPADETSRKRQTIEARTLPQKSQIADNACPSSTGVAGDWESNSVDGSLRKAFFVYVVNVPIINPNEARLFDGYAGNAESADFANLNNYEAYSGNRGFAALEYEQDRVRIPLGNNAIVYENDLDMYSGTGLRVNGRIVANSNMVLGERNNQEIRLYQVSSDDSCFYEAENGKIIVGGNVAYGRIHDNEFAANPVGVDLYRGRGTDPAETDNANTGLSNNTESVAQSSTEVAYNGKAYEERIEYLVQSALLRNENDDPEDVRSKITTRIEDNPTLDQTRVRTEELEAWFRDRTRRVPAAEVPFGSTKEVALGTTNAPGAAYFNGQNNNELRPQDNWILPMSGDTRLTYNLANLPATDPDQLENENFVGDRVTVGNNLPSMWWNSSRQEFSDSDVQNFDEFGTNDNWLNPNGGNSGNARYRKTQVQALVDVGVTERDGFWEEKSMEPPTTPLDAFGGLRVITGAGIYRPADDIITGADTVVWPDTWPQPPDPIRDPDATSHPYYRKLVYDPDLSNDAQDSNGRMVNDKIAIDDEMNPDNNRPYLKMRASVVYHYRAFDTRNINGEDAKIPRPIACVSNFYDPTNWNTAQNRNGLPAFNGFGTLVNSGDLANQTNMAGSNGHSNNGIVYGPPGSNSLGFGGIIGELRYQAKLVYPNGRPVNPLLKKALYRDSLGETLTFAERSAIDAAACSIDILGPSAPVANPSGFPIKDGAIQEIAFLDSRQVKALDAPYDRTDTADDKYLNSYTFQPFPNQGNRDFTYGGYDNLGRSDFRWDSQPSTGQSQYDLEMERRQPLEIRATVIDIAKLREEEVTALQEPEYPGTSTRERLLPASGIIYASRNDALPDASARPTTPPEVDSENRNITGNVDLVTRLAYNEPNQQNPVDAVSGADFWLDPTRRASSILLINGYQFNRTNDNRYNAEEKGLILATNLPAYIQAQNGGSKIGFNVHDHEEFNTALTTDTWANFYNRSDTNGSFACRESTPVDAPTCDGIGDKWRATAVLSDALTLLSEEFRYGFRNEGDYDVRYNQSDNLFRDVMIHAAENNDAPIPLHNKIAPANPEMRAEYESYFGLNATDTPSTGNPFANYFNTMKEAGFRENDYAVNGLSSNNPNADVFGPGVIQRTDDDYSILNGTNEINSTYFNNFITPVQRRVNVDTHEYLMETCPKLPTVECAESVYDDNSWSWVVNSGNSVASDMIGQPLNTTNIQSGTTGGGTDPNPTIAAAQAPSKDFQPFPRRVAFLRKTANISNIQNSSNNSPLLGELILQDNRPIPLGIDTSGNIQCYTYQWNNDSTGDLSFDLDHDQDPLTSPLTITCSRRRGSNAADWPRVTRNALWFAPSRANNNTSRATNLADYNQHFTFRPFALRGFNAPDYSPSPPDPDPDPNRFRQPEPEPVLQLHSVSGTQSPSQHDPDTGNDTNDNYTETNWLPRADFTNTPAEFNFIMATGDSPVRPDEGNGGVANLPRFLENWNGTRTVRIQGSLIELQRSAYATAPFHSMRLAAHNFNDNNGNRSLYRYNQSYKAGSGRFQHYSPPEREWGFDVGLLSQLPDLFSQRFSLPPTDDPNEYFREVSRRDDWVQTLLCGVQTNRTSPSTETNFRADANAVSLDYRPNNCDYGTYNP